MTQKQYLKQVKRQLMLPSKMKYAVLADLQETFESAKEHGEKEESVIKRLGNPENFIEEIMQNSDLPPTKIKYIKRERMLYIALIIVGIITAVFTGFIGVGSFQKSDVIGYANVPTNISVVGGVGYIFPIALCILLWVSFIVLIVYLLYLKKQINSR